MESSQVMAQSNVLPFDPSHVCLADNLVARWNETRIDGPPIGDIEVALPGSDQCPKGLEGFGTVLTEHPAQNSRFEVVNRRPQPISCFFKPTKVSNSSSSPTSGVVSGA